ncbi:MAG TPA: YwbE family protein [Chitinispirillaceae bacterium]|nr:YwbE family protein [Chitinispirillaceae bacterium]
MDGQCRSRIVAGLEVMIVLKKDQQNGTLTRGIVKDVLTNSSTHPHGIKVRLEDGSVGRVKEILPNNQANRAIL